MVFHQVQCPNCFTEYAISEQQYQTSDGMIRCGTCRGQYKAILVSDSTSKAEFDPREAFIEPLTNEGTEPEQEQENEKAKSSTVNNTPVNLYNKDSDSTDYEIEFKSTHEFDSTQTQEPLLPKEENKNDGPFDALTTSEILRNLRKKNNQMLPDDSDADAFEEKTSVSVDASIDQVDKLVDKKLVGKEASRKSQRENANKSSASYQPDETSVTTNISDDFFLEPRKVTPEKKNVLIRFMGFLLSTLLIVLLIIGLLYQLWLKQLINMPTKPAWLAHPTIEQIEQIATPYIDKAKQQFMHYAERYDIDIPERRNLSKLELISATTEPHSNRSTTILLKVSLINRAKISQPLPWLEMSLSDAEGQLVARRNLSPNDYIYNNKTNSNIGPNEMKKITIELLSFPKSATGYEIKLLNK